MDKNQAIIDFLITCPKILNSPLYFNFITGKDKNKQIVTTGNEKTLNRDYIDGSVLKRYTFTIIDFRSIAYRAVVKESGYADENVEELYDVQGVIDWVNEQADLRNFPNFGDDCVIDSMITLTENPNLNGVDTSTSPPLAKYSFSIQIEYLDKSKVVWGK